MPSISLVLLIGIPGVGKSTLVAKISDQLNTKYNILSVSYDRYLNDLSKYREIRYRLFLAVENLVLYLNGNKMKEGEENFLLDDLNIEKNNFPYIILIDDNMHYRSMRYTYHQMCKRHKISFGQIYIKCDLNTALERNFQRLPPFQISQEIITRMSSSIEFPNFHKYKWEKFSLDYQSFDEIDQFLSEVIKNRLYPEKPDESPDNSPSESTLHTIDIILRKRVNMEIKKMTSKDQRKIDEIIGHKNMLLVNIKKGNLFVDPNKIEDDLHDLFTRSFC